MLNVTVSHHAYITGYEFDLDLIICDNFFQTWSHLLLPFSTTPHHYPITNADSSDTIPSHATDLRTASSFSDCSKKQILTQAMTIH